MDRFVYLTKRLPTLFYNYGTPGEKDSLLLAIQIELPPFRLALAGDIGFTGGEILF
jgi:hypothetical protein